MAEAIGIQEILSWVKRRQVTDVEVETDCLHVVQAIRNSVPSFSYLERVIEDYRKLVASLKIQNILFRFIKRFVNNVVHYLARYNCLVANRIWQKEDSILIFIIYIVE